MPGLLAVLGRKSSRQAEEPEHEEGEARGGVRAGGAGEDVGLMLVFKLSKEGNGV